jgi:aspartate kinase
VRVGYFTIYLGNFVCNNIFDSEKQFVKIIVRKYGGSSLANVERIKAIAKSIECARSNDVQLVVVVSAMGNTTDKLFDMAFEISNNPHRRELDMLLSVGERISMALLSMALWNLGIEARSFTGSQSGIVTDDVHNNARIMQVKAERIIHELQKGRVVIVAGFQGVSGAREITTLGRGGSDTSAVAMATALDAERCEIYTDVHGVYSADPRVVNTASKLDIIDFDTMLDMANFGASVIHPRAVELARKCGINLWIKSSMEDAPGTCIGNCIDVS